MSDQELGAAAATGDDRPVQPARPTPPFEPPYYAVVFTSLRTQEDNGYDATAERMDELVASAPGFLGVDSARSSDGFGITVAYFRDEEAIAAWRDDPEHSEARARGRKEWYEGYAVHVAKVERSYGLG